MNQKGKSSVGSGTVNAGAVGWGAGAGFAGYWSLRLNLWEKYFVAPSLLVFTQVDTQYSTPSISAEPVYSGCFSLSRRVFRNDTPLFGSKPFFSLSIDLFYVNEKNRGATPRAIIS